MRLLIIEDELPAAEQLKKLIGEIRPESEMLAVLDSVEASGKWLRRNESPDLIFMDIQLADGLSFDIFSRVDILAPVIFTTAYDKYTLRAFKVNSVDYLLKPIEPEELERAFRKYERVHQPRFPYKQELIDRLIQSVSQPVYKERFLVKAGQQLTYLPVDDIRFLYSEDGLVYVRTVNAKKHHLDYTLEALEEVLNPAQFFRPNRKIIIRIDAIQQISPYFNSRLILELRPEAPFKVIVSRERVSDFKNWLDQ